MVATTRVAQSSNVIDVDSKAERLSFQHAGKISLYDSYHCSRYNTNTRVLTPQMFHSVFARVREDIG